MAQLTDEEFIDLFGMDPNAPVKRKDAYVPPIQRALDGDLSIANIFDAAFGITTAMPNIASKLIQGEKLTPQDVNGGARSLQNARAAIPAIAAGVPAIADLVGKGVPAVIEGTLSDDDKAITSRIADSFMNRILPPEGMDRIADKQAVILENFVQQNPDATQDDIAAFHKQYLESDEFYKELVSELPAGLAASSQ